MDTEVGVYAGVGVGVDAGVGVVIGGGATDAGGAIAEYGGVTTEVGGAATEDGTTTEGTTTVAIVVGTETTGGADTTGAGALLPGAKQFPPVGALNGIPVTVVVVTRSAGPGFGYNSAVPAVLRHSPGLICPGMFISPTYMFG